MHLCINIIPKDSWQMLGAMENQYLIKTQNVKFMKNFVKIATALLMGTFLFSCNDDSTENLRPEDSQSSLSEIELEHGMNLFKKEVKLMDRLSSGSVTLLVAAKTEKDLTGYLATTDFSATFLDEASLKKNEKASSDGSKVNTAKGVEIFIEVIASTLPVGKVGYKINVSENKNASPNVRIPGYPYEETVYSGIKDDYSYVECLDIGTPPFLENIAVERSDKDCGICGYNYVYGSSSLSPGFFTQWTRQARVIRLRVGKNVGQRNFNFAFANIL